MSQDTETAAALELSQPNQPLRAPVPMGDRGLVISDLEGLWRFSGYVAKSGLAPKGIEKQESIFVAIQMGFEVGLTPMAALQNIAVINGRPSIWGDAQLAVVRASGKLEAYLEEETNNDMHPLFVDMCLETDGAKRRELKKDLSRKQASIKSTTDDFGFSVCVVRSGEEARFGRFTVADAKLASLWNKSGPWQQYPKRMLKFRARSFVLRDCFGDALKGMLSAEEVQDLSPEGRFKAAKPAVESKVTMLHSLAPAAAQEQEAPTPTEAAQDAPATEAKPATATPQEKLVEMIKAEGFSFAELIEWAVTSGNLDAPVNTPDEIPAKSAEKWLNAKKGLLAGLTAGRGK